MGVAARLAREQAARPTPRALAALRDRLEQRHPRERRRAPRSTARRAPRVPNTTNISFDGVEAESLLIALDLEGFAVSTGSACSSGTLEPSHVLRAMNLPSHRTQNSIRFSLGAGNTEEQVDALLAKLPTSSEASHAGATVTIATPQLPMPNQLPTPNTGGELGTWSWTLGIGALRVGN